MAERSGLLEKESAAFASEKERPSVQPSHSNLSQTAVISPKQPGSDEFLENTLLNVKLAESLTKREAEILKLIISGQTNRKIAQNLYRTERTIEYHRHELMRKLGAHNAAELVKRAITMGIA
jgi:DNA-binding NarL/FixJ family response regulator